MAKHAASLQPDCLEERLVPAVTYHGGNLLAHVEAQALYLGASWSSVPADVTLAAQLGAFVNGVVQGTYMDMLTRAGYNVGRGSAGPGVLDPISYPSGTLLTDAQIQHELQAEISAGKVQAPDANRLYIVFVQDNVLVQDPFGDLSTKGFVGYHYAFQGTTPQGPADIRYAVLPTPGGAIGNAAVHGLPALNSITAAASHEIAEGVTDPDADYRTLGWYDDSQGNTGEIGDIVNGQLVYLGGYAVQKIADRNDQPMAPPGAAPVVPATFILLQNGQLLERAAAGTTTIGSGFAQLSGQAIDNLGRAMVDVVTAGGLAYEYHDGQGWVYLNQNVKSAGAGNAVSYVLLSNGGLWEYRDAGSTWVPVSSTVASIDAGTDQAGVNMVDLVTTSGAAWEHSDGTGWHFLASAVKQASAGPGGASVLLLLNGSAQQYSEATGSLAPLASGVTQVAAGTDPTGTPQFEVLTTSGAAYEYRAGGMSLLWSGARWVGKPHAGTTTILFTYGATLLQHDSTGWHTLAGGAAAGA